MREFGVRRYGDTLYHHCMADSAADAANWFAHFQTGIEGKDFQALVKDVARRSATKPVSAGTQRWSWFVTASSRLEGRAAIDFEAHQFAALKLVVVFWLLGRRP